MSEMLFSLASNPGAGKTTIARQLAEEFEIPYVSGSTILTEWAEEREIKLVERADYCSFIYQMRQELGPTCMWETVLEHRNENGVMFDGMRNLNDLAVFQKMGGVLAALWCPYETRLQRSQERNDIKDAGCEEDFRAGELFEYDSQDPNGMRTMIVMQMADFSVDASQSRENVLEATRRGFMSCLALR